MTQLTPLQRRFLNQFQGGFPLTERPFSNIAALLGATEASLIQLVRELLHERIITRFGPFYNADRLGGAFTLAAMSIPDERFDEVAAIVNAIPAVAHNYRREHHLNMWFVVATATREAIADTIRIIEQESGLRVFNFPKLQEFYLGLRLHIDERGNAVTLPLDQPPLHAPFQPDPLDRRIINATQAGLPLVPEPYAEIAQQIGSEQTLILERLENMLRCGMIRRIGAAPNHYRLGLKANGMTVWDVEDSILRSVGEKMGELSFVSHCYERPRQLPDWPYNLFAMVHGTDRQQVIEKLEKMKTQLAGSYRSMDVLFSSAILKKTGLRFAA